MMGRTLPPPTWWPKYLHTWYSWTASPLVPRPVVSLGLLPLCSDGLPTPCYIINVYDCMVRAVHEQGVHHALKCGWGSSEAE